MSELMVSDEVTSRLHRLAQQTGASADALAERALREFLRAEARRALQVELQAFQAQHAALWAQYPHQYVAIYQQQLVDHDPDQLILLERIERAYPATPVLITPVVAVPEETYTLRSPRWDADE